MGNQGRSRDGRGGWRGLPSAQARNGYGIERMVKDIVPLSAGVSIAADR